MAYRNIDQDLRTTASPTFDGATFTETVNGVAPTLSGHLTTKVYVDTEIDYLSGQIDTNTTNITSNDNDIDYLSGVIDTNTANITTVSGDLSSFSNNIDTLSSRFDDINDATIEPTGFPRDLPLLLGDISFDDGSLTFTIEPQGGQPNFTFYAKGVKFERTTPDTVVITDTEGLWFIYYNTSQVLTASQTPWTFGSGLVFVAIVYWDATNKKGVVGEERHGITMDHDTHEYLHQTAGATYQNGFTPSLTVDGDGSLSAHCEMQSISLGSFYDEDILNSNTEQTDYEIWWKEGTNADWRWDTAAPALIKFATTLPYYNQLNGSTWQLTEMTNNDFILAHLFATNRDGSGKVIIVMGENVYGTVGQARTGAQTEILNITTGSLPTPEFIEIASIIIQGRTLYTNVYNARVVSTDEGADFVDFRQNEKIGVGASISDHSNLVGLTNDDHLQYSLVDGTRAFTGAVGGVTPVLSGDLTTKYYVDNSAIYLSGAIDLNTTHRTSDGTDHTFIDQDVTTSGTPSFTKLLAGETSFVGSEDLRVGGHVIIDDIKIFNNNGENVNIGHGSIGNDGLGYQNIAIGKDSLAAIILGGNYNTAIGTNAGAALTTGDLNVAIGYGALKSSAGQYSAVAIGSYTMEDTTTASNGPIAIGHYAMGNAPTVGSYSLAIGFQAGEKGNCGNNTISIGYNAMRNATVGESNIAIGNGAIGTTTGHPGDNNVAIGASTLAILDSSTSDANVALGANALGNTATSNRNIAIGDRAMYTGGGAYNVAVGVESGYETSGTFSVLMGYQAGRYQTTGASNVAIGRAAMGVGITTGSNNVVIGVSAGLALTSGAQNILIGLTAGQGITTGIENIVMGNQTFDANTAGQHNIAMGALAGTLVSAGNFNILIGNSSLANATGTCTDNILLGRYAGLDHTSTTLTRAIGIGVESVGNTTTIADDVIAIGYRALYNASGLGNTSIGYQAGDLLTTGTYNTIIGYNADVVGNGNTNSIVIGYNAVGQGDNTVVIGNSSITENYLNGAVLINGTSLASTEKLNVNGSAVIGGTTIYSGDDMLIYSGTGDRNVNIGHGTPGNAGAGSFNVAIGLNPLTSVAIGGTYNIAVGAYAGQNISTGDHNIIIGYWAGRYHADGVTVLTTPAKSIYIGYECKGKDNNDDGSIVIGYNAIGQGANTAVWGGSAITDNYLNGIVHVDGDVVVTGQMYSDLPSTLTPSTSALTVDWDDGNGQVIDFAVAPSGVTLTLDNPNAGASYLLEMIQTVSGDFVDVTLPSNVLIPDGTAPNTLNITETSGAIDTLTLFYDGTNYIAQLGQNYG